MGEFTRGNIIARGNSNMSITGENCLGEMATWDLGCCKGQQCGEKLWETLQGETTMLDIAVG